MSVSPETTSKPNPIAQYAAAESSAGAALKETARTAAEALREATVALSHAIHAEPETAYQEFKTADKLVAYIEGQGFTVERGVADLDTAFTATKGTGELVIGICSEMDALPEVGHACAHNMIGSSGVLAAAVLGGLADELGITVKLFGTPAEELGAGKVFMLERGAFDGVNAAMMVHPGTDEESRHFTRAINDYEVLYHGKTAHSAGAPWNGINAGDAVTVAQVAIGLLRQHLRPGNLLHGIVTKAGEAPNIVPGESSMYYNGRASTIEELEELKLRLFKCFEAGATATGCSFEIKEDWPAYSEFRNDYPFSATYQRNAEALGRTFDNADEAYLKEKAGSTDMANISLLIPTIHPSVRLNAGGAGNHQPEFAAYTVTEEADEAMWESGLAMAWTAIDLALDPQQRARLLSTRIDHTTDTGVSHS